MGLKPPFNAVRWTCGREGKNKPHFAVRDEHGRLVCKRTSLRMAVQAGLLIARKRGERSVKIVEAPS